MLDRTQSTETVLYWYTEQEIYNNFFLFLNIKSKIIFPYSQKPISEKNNQNNNSFVELGEFLFLLDQNVTRRIRSLIGSILYLR